MTRLLPLVIVTLTVHAFVGVASGQDLRLDPTKSEIQVLYVGLGTAPEARMRLYRETDGRETQIAEQTIKVAVGTRVQVPFAVSVTTNCLYRVEIVEGERRATEALNLYDPLRRTPEKRRQISSLLAIPIELIGSFLEKYTSALMSPAAGIWRMEVNSGELARIGDAAEGRILELAIAPDGTVAFAATTPQNPSGELFVTRAGGKPTSLTQGSSPVWNKDGDRIFFIRDGRVLAMSASSQVSVPVSDAAGPAFDRLLGFPAGGDGRLLTASKLGSDSLAFWLVDVTTGAVDSVSYDVAYLWLRGLSPDRRTIVYSYYVGAGARSRLMLRMLPNEGRPLTDGRWDDTSPAWSPDGKAIYFVSDRPARSN